MAGPPSGIADEGTAGQGATGQDDVDRSLRVTVPLELAEEAGALLMDVLGSLEEEIAQSTAGSTASNATVTLVFYPPIGAPWTRDGLLALLPAAFGEPGALAVQARDVPRDWVEGWREHFRPAMIGIVRVRPPWEPALPAGPGTGAMAARAGAAAVPFDGTGALAVATSLAPVDVVINPGLGFGTGLHPTTRGTLLLLQENGPERLQEPTGAAAPPPAQSRRGARGPLVDVGTGSGILAIAAAKLGWAPIVALDNDPVALVSARENVAANGVEDVVDVREADSGSVDESWFRNATVLANMTLEPVTALLRRLAGKEARPRRLVVSGILAGDQEESLLGVARAAGFDPGLRRCEQEWVSLELLPAGSAE
jgi:ribosomal protein L11 methyltransferase